MTDYIVRDADSAGKVAGLIAGLSTDKHAWDVSVKRHVKKVSDPQRGLYFKWLTIIGNELGYSKDEMHDALREKFLPWEDVEIFGMVKRRLTSTSAKDFGSKRMSEYMDEIDRFAAQELGILLPHPDDPAYEEWMARQ